MTRPGQPWHWVWPVATRAACLGAGLSAEKCARQLGWAQTEAAELSLVVVELTTNAVRHGRRGTCTLVVDAEQAKIDVQDEGPGYPAWVLSCVAVGRSVEAAARTETGRSYLPSQSGLGAGLDVVRRLANEVILTNDERGRGARALVRIARRTGFFAGGR